MLARSPRVPNYARVSGDPHGQGGKPPCKQAKRVRPEGGCGVIPMEIFFDFLFFPKKMTRFDHHFEAKD